MVTLMLTIKIDLKDATLVKGFTLAICLLSHVAHGQRTFKLEKLHNNF